MSDLLDALIKQRKQEALDYAAYLAKIVELTKKVKNGPSGTAYPQSLNSPAKRALYDNLGKDETLALKVDAAVRETRQDGFRNHPIKLKQVKYAIKKVAPMGDAALDQLLEIVKNQSEY